MTLHIRQTILDYLIGRGMGAGEDHAIYVDTTEIVRLFPTVSDPLRRLRELKEDRVEYEYLGKRQYKIWLRNNGQGKEGQLMHGSGLSKLQELGQPSSPNLEAKPALADVSISHEQGRLW